MVWSMKFLIAYDIAHPRRLRRVARRLERSALRCQKSVFLFDGPEAELHKVLEELKPMLNLNEDIVQAWKLPKGEPVSGIISGTRLNLRPASVVVHASGNLFVGDRES